MVTAATTALDCVVTPIPQYSLDRYPSQRSLVYTSPSSKRVTQCTIPTAMRVTGSRVYSRPAPVPKMPTGLVELMEGLTRDVLKNNPPDVYEFCADHMLKLLEIRDGPSKKPLSLQQKILKAQEKVKIRAEQRWKQYSENLHKQTISDNASGARYQPAAADGNSILNVPKPVCHVQNLTQTSEMEISCESMNAGNDKQCDDLISKCTLRSPESEKCENKAVEIEANQDSISEKVSNDEQNDYDENKIQDVPNVNYTLEEQNISVSPEQHENKDEVYPESHHEKEEKNVLQPNVIDHSDIIESVQDENKKELSMQCGDVDDKGVINKTSDCSHVDSTVQSAENRVTAEEYSTSVINEIPNTPVENVSNPPIEKVPSTTIELVPNCVNEEDINSSIKEVSNLAIDEVSNSVIEQVSNSAINSEKDKQAHESEFRDINQSINKEDNVLPDLMNTSEKTEVAESRNLSDLNTQLRSTDIDETSNVSKVIILDNSENESEVIEDTKNIELDSIVNDVQTEEMNNAVDLEKVLNEAMENTIRKDSCANDHLSDINILNEEESDTSEGTNVINNVADYKIKEEIGASRTTEISVSIKNPDTTITNLLETDIVCKNNDDPEEIKQIKRDDGLNTNDNNANDITKEESSTNSNDVDVARNDISNTMDLETAAVTIQKVFRTFLFKSRTSTFDETVNDEINLSDEEDKKGEQQFLPSNINKERRTLGISRMDTVLQTVNEEKSLSLSTDDSSLSSAATIIQAHVRGFLVRNKLYHGKTASSNSLAISNEPSSTSMDADADPNKSKTILNIHIVPEGGNYLSRDESMITSMDLSLDGSPPSSVNLHPHGYNTSERRKQLKREDAVQSVSPPSNNSGKLSEDVDSVKEITINENEYNNSNQDEKLTMASLLADSHHETDVGSLETTPTNSLTIETVVEDNKTPNMEMLSSPESVTESSEKKRSLTKQSSDEMDVVTPFKDDLLRDATPKLLHSGEFHDAALPTKVSRSDTPVASEFKNVLVYFLLWNKSTHGSY